MRVGSHVNEGRLDPNMCMVHVCVHKQAPLQVHMCAHACVCAYLCTCACIHTWGLSSVCTRVCHVVCWAEHISARQFI